MSRRRIFTSMCALVFLVHMGRVIFAALLDPIMQQFAVGPGVAGFVATAVWLGSALPRVPVGYLLTRIPRQQVILGAGGMLTTAAAFGAFVPTIGLLTVAAFLIGLSSGAYFIAANPLVSELYPERVGRAIGIHGSAAQLAGVLAAPFVGVMLAFGDFRLAFLTMAAAALAVTMALLWIARDAEFPAAGAEDRDLLGAARAQWRLILTGVAIIGSAFFVWNGVFNFYVTYLTGTKGLAPATARDLLTVIFAAGVPAFFIGGRLADRFPNVPLLLGLIAAFTLTLVTLTVVTGLIALVIVTVVMGFVAHSFIPAIDTYLLSALPDHHRSSAYSVYSGIYMIVQALGSTSVGSLTAAGIAFDTVFQGGAGGLFLIVVGLTALHRLDRLPRGGRPASKTSDF
ncbi:MAG: MFS transporter [Halobacteriales archaeon]